MWLELHDTNGPIYINMNNVTHFQRVEGQRRTTLVTFAPNSGTCGMFKVQESPEEIIEMLSEEY
ncbi:hypothetical protein [Ensifer aridi]|uniref:hypothetical protein n=1 Tax=Ensifer aridi TaxID=1708715 RepID=UPI000A0F97F3|nr:hypothetical protein [Ensifer aridi]